MIDTLRELASALFLGWRRALTAIASGLQQAWCRTSRAASRWQARWSPVRSYLADTESAWQVERGTVIGPAVAFGVRAFACGMLVSIGVAISTGSGLAAAVLPVLTEALWTAARLMIVLLVVPTTASRRDVLCAFGAGLAPYALGFTPLLRLASLILSGILTARGLAATGVAAGNARAATTWAFGGQAAIVVSGTVVRGAIALLGGL